MFTQKLVGDVRDTEICINRRRSKVFPEVLWCLFHHYIMKKTINNGLYSADKWSYRTIQKGDNIFLFS